MSASRRRRSTRSASYEAVEALMRVSQAVERRRRQLARAAGLSEQQWSVLEEIGLLDFMPSLCARGRDTSPAAISRTLRQLLERGLVSVAISERDARRREYSLTARGEAVLEDLRVRRERALSAVWDTFPVTEVKRFARFNRGLAERLEAYAQRIEDQA